MGPHSLRCHGLAAVIADLVPELLGLEIVEVSERIPEVMRVEVVGCDGILPRRRIVLRLRPASAVPMGPTPTVRVFAFKVVGCPMPR